MTIIHMVNVINYHASKETSKLTKCPVLFKFRSDITTEHKAKFISETLKNLPSVKGNRLIVGGPSVSTLISSSKGFEFALVSYHEDRKALGEYQESEEHHRAVSTYLHPFKEDLVRFDFEVDNEYEGMCGFLPGVGVLHGIGDDNDHVKTE